MMIGPTHMNAMNHCRSQRRAGGFTLVEIMIVVGIIGLLSMMAVPAFIRARDESKVSRFINDMRVATEAFHLYNLENGDYPPDAMHGEMPVGMAGYLAKMDVNGDSSISIPGLRSAASHEAIEAPRDRP